MILFLYPTFVLLINKVVFKQVISRTQMIALFLTYAGIGIAYFNEMQLDTSNPYFFWGSLLIFLCSITYAIYIAGSGKVIPVIGAAKFAARHASAFERRGAARFAAFLGFARLRRRLILSVAKYYLGQQRAASDAGG